MCPVLRPHLVSMPYTRKLPDVAAVATRMRHICTSVPQTAGPSQCPRSSGSSTHNRGTSGPWASGGQCKGSTSVRSGTATGLSEASCCSFAFPHSIGRVGQIPCLLSQIKASCKTSGILSCQRVINTRQGPPSWGRWRGSFFIPEIMMEKNPLFPPVRDRHCRARSPPKHVARIHRGTSLCARWPQ